LLSLIESQLLKPTRRWFRPKGIQGLYIYGQVGAGKTCLMDLFCESIPNNQVLRLHFYVFMDKLFSLLKQYEGHADPLRLIAKKFRVQYRVMCLDEMMVQDITHAMILKNVLEACIDAGITFITTSNVLPDELYKNGLNRERFLGAIALIKTHCDVFYLKQYSDYRLAKVTPDKVYFCEKNSEEREDFYRYVPHFFSTGALKVQSIRILEREIAVRQVEEKCIWVDFYVLASLPRSHQDYVQLMKQYRRFIVSGLPDLDTVPLASQILWVAFIDVLYDFHAGLIVLSEIPLAQQTMHGEMASTFPRTLSRMLEITSADYFLASN